MKRSALLVFAALIGSVAHLQAQGLLQTVITPEKAVAVVNQTMEGTWLSEVRPAGLPASASPILNLATYNSNGTMLASASDGTQSLAHGVWVRVGDRKFLQTVFIFNYDASRVLTTITKARINIQMSLDGQTLKATNEVVVMDRTGKVMATIPGGTGSAVRLSPEIPGDFYDFQKVQ
ncbi:MAG: hypothetical protein NTW28_12675 [Candidatus Solibacter sp.]|nr:hypothetical protein [Candidatus Solibacter sp.]